MKTSTAEKVDPAATRYMFTVVSPMYNVERYLPEFLDSLLHQLFPFERIQLIPVDDGSSDATADVARSFARRHPENVVVLQQANGGQASARNLGLTEAVGEWVTFPDPDDVLERHYFSRLAAAISEDGGSSSAYAARIRMWFEATGHIKNNHALDFRFRRGQRTVSLLDEPKFIHPHVTTAVFRRDVFDAFGLRFPEGLRLRFEDAVVSCQYFLAVGQPTISYVPGAEYFYRQRADESSTIQSTRTDPRKYTDPMRLGFMEVIRFAGSGELPVWLQNVFLYDVLWIFRSSQGPAVRKATFPAEMHREIDELMPQWLSRVSLESIAAFDVMTVPHWMKDALALWKLGSGSAPVHLGAIDAKRGLVCLIYRYRGARPTEIVRVNGHPVDVRYAKDWALEYVGRGVVWQRYLWVALSGAIEIELDGVPQSVLAAGGSQTLDRVDPELLATRSAVAAARAEAPSASLGGLRLLRRRVGLLLRELRSVQRDSPRLREATRRFITSWCSLSPLLTRRYRGAWVFIDRDVDANDSAEVLYKWVRAEHPEVNAWFAIRRDSPEWGRLRAEGFRLVDYGSPAFAALIMSAEHIAPSHADRFISDPLPKRYGRKSWNFTFLQHGVIKGDISGWLNPKAISTFVVPTEDEYDYVSGPSPFRFGPKEVRLTGLPRFDALLEQDGRVTDSDRDVILVMPTWRDYLVGGMAASSRDRAALDGFSHTTYAKAIRELLTRLSVQENAANRGSRIVFMPHPNMRMYLHQFDLPHDIEVASYDDVDVREMIARARVLVTDYSSVAFNMAYVQRPVVYFQFDRDDYYTGHTERPGYFTYETHGFGPIVETAAEAAQSVADALTGRVDPEFQLRMERTFPVRDGQNSRRVFEAMVESRTMRSLSERSTAAPPDRWADLA